MANNREKVSVTCAECGCTRMVRPALVRGFDALVCARHHRPDPPASLIVPAGHAVLVTSDVAGYFIGYTIKEPSPAQARSLGRAAALAAAVAGRPAPPLPPVEDVPAWQPVVDALTAELGPDGWELADAVRERGDRGRVWVVKIYTDFGWAGFLDGSPWQIARDLAAIRDDYAAQTAAAGLTCPRCDADLSPTAPATRCGCGSVAWWPAFWNASDLVSAIADMLAYLDDAPPYEAAAEQVLLTLLLEPPSEWNGIEIRQSEITFDRIAVALRVLVPQARWATIGERLCGVLPVGVRWEGGRAAQLRRAACALGYRLYRGHPINLYGGRSEDFLQIACLSAGEDTDDDLPAWFDVTALKEGWQLRIDGDADRLRQRCVDDLPDVDEDDLDEVFDEVLLRTWEPLDPAVWPIAASWYSPALAIERPVDDPFDPAGLLAALREGVEAVTAFHTVAAKAVIARFRGGDQPPAAAAASG